MHRLLPLLVLLAAAPAAAQTPATGDRALAQTAAQFEDDLGLLTRAASAAALARAETGSFPDTPFTLLAGPWAGQTGLRSVPLSSLDVTAEGDRLVLTLVPLPQDPYVREDDVARLTLTPDGETVRGEYEVVRRADPDDGGAPIPYDVAGRYRVERAFGTLCVEVPRIRALVAEGRFVPDPTLLSSEPLTVRVHPPGEETPVFYETVRPTERPAPRP